jgi:putative cardiolipin synthase
LTSQVEAFANSPDFKLLAGIEVGAAIRQHKLAFPSGPTHLVADQPEKITTDPSDTSTHLLPELRRVVDATKREVVIVSPYFIPGSKGMEFFRSLRARGLRVVVLSNSLAANDVIAVHAGYRRYRKALLLAGVELWEIKPDAQLRASARGDKGTRPREGHSPGSSLHAKSFIFDRQTLFVGSLNLDPRSGTLNTEMGLVMEVPTLAGPVVDTLEASLVQDAYRLEFVPGPGPHMECGNIVWLSQENGREVRYTHEPQASFCRRLRVCLASLLPIESQL